MPITYFVAFLVAVMVATSLTVGVRHLATRWGWLDHGGSSRKIHGRAVPRLGGIAIVAGFFAPLAGLFLVDSSVGTVFQSDTQLVLGLFGGGLAIAALGVYDDLRGAGARKKFLVQFAVAGGLYAIGFRVEQLANPFGEPISLGIFAIPFTVLWMVGVVNAINLIDGLDGLAGGVAFFGLATNFVLALSQGNVLMCLLMAALAGAVLGFLVFNFNPASIFMGDTGSMFLGFVLASVSIKTSTKSGTAVAMLVPIIALGLPIMDTLLAMIRRAILGRPMFSADKEHIHHRLMSRLLLSHRRAVLVLYGICCLFTLTALGLAYANSAQSAMLLCGVGVVVVVLMRKLGYLSVDKAGAVTKVRRRNNELRSLVKTTEAAIEAADSSSAIWEAVRPLVDHLGAARLELRLRGVLAGGGEDGALFDATRPVGTALPLEVRLEIRAGDEGVGSLFIAWRDGRPEVNRDEELALELIVDSLGHAVAGLAAERAEGAKVVSIR